MMCRVVGLPRSGRRLCAGAYEDVPFERLCNLRRRAPRARSPFKIGYKVTLIGYIHETKYPNGINGSPDSHDLLHNNLNHDGLSSLLRYYVTTRIRDMPYLPPFNVIIADIVRFDDIYHLSYFYHTITPKLLHRSK